MAKVNSSSSFDIPNPNATKAEKESIEYGVQYANYIYSLAMKDDYTFFSRRRRIRENRMWAQGTQSIDHLKDLDDFGGDTSWLSLDFTTPSPLPKFANLFVGAITNKSYDLVVEAIDNKSKGKRDEEYKRRLKKMKIKPLEPKLKELGVNIDLSDAPDSEEDIELDMELNWKAPLEAGLEAGIRQVFAQAGKDELERKMAWDYFCAGAAVTKSYRDEEGIDQVRYTDIANFITSYATKDNYSDAYFMGEVYQMSISEAQVKFPNANITKDEWVQIAASFGGNYGNETFSVDDYYNGSVSWEALRSFKVLVLDFQFKSTNTYRFKKKENKKGSGFKFDLVEETYDPKYAKTKTEIEDRKIEDVYEGVWVCSIGSNWMLSYGKKDNIVHKNLPNSEGIPSPRAEFDYTIYMPNMYDMTNKPLVELIRPHAEQIIVYNLKIMHFVMKAVPPGAAVDVTALSEVSQGLGDPQRVGNSSEQIYDRFLQTGVFNFASIREDGSPITNTQPIIPLANGVSPSIQYLLQLRDAELNEIYNVSGFNPAIDGSAPSKDALVGIEKMRANSFNLAMKPWADSVIQVVENTANLVAEKQKDRIRYDKTYAEYISEQIGKDKVDVIELVEDAKLSDIGVKVYFRPTEEELIELSGALEKAFQTNQITIADYMNTKEIAKTSLKGANIYLKKAVEKKRMADMETAQANSTQQAEVQAYAAQISEQAKQQTIQLEYDLKLRNMRAEKMLEAGLIIPAEKQRKIEEILVDKETDIEVIEAAQQTDTDGFNPKSTQVTDKIRKRNENTQSQEGVPKVAQGPRVGMSPEDNAQRRVAQ